MKHISLQSVDMMHFKSFASAHVGLRRGPGLRMVFGENRREPRLGANGAGKSTIWDAVCYCLSGRSVRGKRASELVTTGRKATSVETAWMIDGEARTVKRTGPPERMFVDGEPCGQGYIDELMGLSRDRFLASVLFGQAQPLFVDLSVPERGDILDEVLGLGFWIRAADLATSRWNATGIEMQRLQREVARLDGALAELPREADLVQAIDDFDARRAEEVDELRAQRYTLDQEYRGLRRSAGAVGVSTDRRDEVDRLRDELSERVTREASEVAVLGSEVARLSRDFDFFNETGECPTCGQEIDERFAEAHLDDLRREHDEKVVLLAAARDRLDSTREQTDALVAEMRALADGTRERHRLDLAVVAKRGEISTLDNRILLLLDQANPHVDQLRSVEARRVELDGLLAAKRAEESVLSARIDRLDFWRQGFRRVRVFCLTRVLAELEVATMTEARSLGLIGWNIGFTGETETKSGTVRLGVQAIVRSPEAKRDFDSFSPGEGQRVRCASALGLASLIQRYSGVSYDFEVWDEPSAWLSAEGIDDLFESLRERAHGRGKSIWVVDPRAGLSHGGFDEVWNVIKTDEGSRIEIARVDVHRGVRVESDDGCAGDGAAV
jgi:DNA repair exonuclease SbcCD ATPase subunit